MDSLSISWSMYIYKPILVQLKRHLKFGAYPSTIEKASKIWWSAPELNNCIG